MLKARIEDRYELITASLDFDDPWKVMSDEDRKEANRLFKLIMRAYPSSPKQKAMSQKLQDLFKKYGIGEKNNSH